MEYLQDFSNSALTFGGNLARWGYAHPGEAMGWLVGLFALLKGLTWSGGKVINRNKARAAQFLKEVLDVERNAGLDVATTIPVDDPRRELGVLAANLSPDANNDEPYGAWEHITNFATKVTPGGRSRRARRRFDQTIVAILKRWKTESPTPQKAQYARALAEAVSGRDIGEYINSGATASQIIDASTRRYLAVARRKRTSPRRVASLMAIASTAYREVGAEARLNMTGLHEALQVVGNPKNLAVLVRLIQAEPLLAQSLKNGSGSTGGLQLASHPVDRFGSRSGG